MHYYLDPRVLRIFVLGLASGLPWVLIGSMLTLWLKDAGLSRSSIGYAGAIYAAYSINFIWSPLIDNIKRPLLFRLGQRKSWILLAQLGMIAACLSVAGTDPTVNASLTILFCLAIAVASATQDIAIDAYRIDSIPEQDTERMSIAASMAIAGWWTGYAGIGAAALLAADSFTLSWPDLYLLIIPVLTIISILTLIFPEPPAAARENAQGIVRQHYLNALQHSSTQKKLLSLLVIASPFLLAVWTLSGGIGIAWTIKQSAFYVPGSLLLGFALLLAGIVLLQGTITSDKAGSSVYRAGTIDLIVAHLATSIIQPFTSFIQRSGLKIALNILLFIVLFKIGEAFLGRMSLVFYKEVGFSNSDIAYYSKLISWGVTVIFSLVSGLFAARFGVMRGLIIAGIAMAASNLMFSVMALMGPVKWLFALTVVVDGFTSAWANVAFVAFLSSLCDRTYTATQYALLASLGTLGRTFFASSSGQLVDWLDGNWTVFFILTAIAVVPALWLLLKLHHKTDLPATDLQHQ